MEKGILLLKKNQTSETQLIVVNCDKILFTDPAAKKNEKKNDRNNNE